MLGFQLGGTKSWRLSHSSAWGGSRGGAGRDAEEVEGGGRLIRHGARAQSPPLDIMCLPAARTRTHHLSRVCTRRACARASVTVPATEMYPLCNRVLSELRYSCRSTVLAADVGTSPNLRRFTLGEEITTTRRSSFRTLRGSRENRRYMVHVSFVSFAHFALGPETRSTKHEERESARGDTARCSPFPATAEATHVARRSFVIRQIAFLPRARGAKCVCDARTHCHARLVHLTQAFVRS